MATSSKRACAIPRSAVPRAPAPCSRPLLTRTSVGDTQTLKGRSNSVSVGFPGAHNVLFEPSESLWWVWGLILNAILPLLSSRWGFSFALRRGIYFLVGSNILLSMVVQQRVVILEFLQEKMNTRPSIPSSHLRCESESHLVVSDSETPWTYSSRNSPGQNAGMGSLSLLQGIFPTQGLNPGLLHCRQILYHLSHQGSPI